MKRIEDPATLSGERLGPTDSFRFRCHPALACFNRCCRNLNLFLYPYDVLRLSRGLEMDTDVFLERHVDVVMRAGNHFPDVLLRMRDNAEKTCPFLTGSGCRVYADRPDTCRSFPVERGVLMGPDGKVRETINLFRPPPFCLGRNETVQWRVSSWIRDQDAEEHYRMTVAWADVKQRFAQNPWGPEGAVGPRAKMAFMATYNMDRFRSFVFDSSFLTRHRIAPELLARMRTDDTALLSLGFDWVNLFLWGVPSALVAPMGAVEGG